MESIGLPRPEDSDTHHHHYSINGIDGKERSISAFPLEDGAAPADFLRQKLSKTAGFANFCFFKPLGDLGGVIFKVHLGRCCFSGDLVLILKYLIFLRPFKGLIL